MKEIRRIIDVYEKLDFSKRKVALATVVAIEGSSYRRPGARMLIMDDGRWEGAISGGCLEGDALTRARNVMLSNIPELVTYDTMDDDANSLEIGLGCNGIIDVFIEPVNPGDHTNPVAYLKEYVRNREMHALATVLKTGKGSDFKTGKRFILTEKDSVSIPDWLFEDMQQVLDDGNPRIKNYDQPGGIYEVFIERITPDLDLIIFGAGFDVVPVVKIANELGWQVTVTEDCVAHLAPKRFTPSTCLLYAERDAVLEKIIVNERTAAILMSHNYRYDLAVLEALLTTEMPYIGILGPLKRYEKLKAEIKNNKKNHISAESFSRVHAPIGLDIGAETPDEIAVSIISEIKAFFAERSAGFLKNRKIPIHPRNNENPD